MQDGLNVPVISKQLMSYTGNCIQR